jgi:hypothetical protein
MGLVTVEEDETMPNSDKSIFNMVIKHEEEFEKHEQRLDDHELQLRVQAEQIKQLQDNAIKLENVVMAENRETRLTITQTNQQLHELINGLMGYNSGQNQLQHTLRMAKLESWSKIVAYLAGSGGLIYFLIEKL